MTFAYVYRPTGSTVRWPALWYTSLRPRESDVASTGLVTNAASERAAPVVTSAAKAKALAAALDSLFLALLGRYLISWHVRIILILKHKGPILLEQSIEHLLRRPLLRGGAVTDVRTMHTWCLGIASPFVRSH